MFNQAMLMNAPAASNNFKTFSYTGTGSAQSFTTPGFQPDLIMIIAQSSASPQIPVFDSTNGVGKYSDLSGTNESAYQTDAQSVTAFNPTGFSVGTSAAVNANGIVYQAACWKKLASLLDIVSYTGNHTARTISHALGEAPAAILINGVSAPFSGYWPFYDANMVAPAKSSYELIGLNSTLTVTTGDTTIWNNADPTSSVFSLGVNNIVNANTSTYVAYLLGALAGQSAFGTYTGNGSVSGPSVSGLGFTPSFVAILDANASSQNMQLVYGNTKSQIANNQQAASSTNFIDLVSGGFNVKTTNADFNTNAHTYMYMAWK